LVFLEDANHEVFQALVWGKHHTVNFDAKASSLANRYVIDTDCWHYLVFV
jgi:hypothetical protein